MKRGVETSIESGQTKYGGWGTGRHSRSALGHWFGTELMVNLPEAARCLL